MLYDKIKIIEGADVENLTVKSGTSFPGNANAGEIFYKSDTNLLYFYNGTEWGAITGAVTSEIVTSNSIETALGFAPNVYDISLSIEGKPTASSSLLTFPAVRTFSIPVNFENSIAKSDTSSSGEAVFSIRKNNTEFGTVTFSSSSQGTFSSATQVTFLAGDILKIVAPSSQDSTLENIGITIRSILE